MPLLKPELQSFPADLFDLPTIEHPWWVAHVRSRQEKALARYLAPQQVPFYLPQREHSVRRAGRNRVSYLPLFSGYLFFRGFGRERLSALRSDLIVKVLPVFDQGRLDDELRQLRALQEAGATFFPQVVLVPGDAVRIAEGPFAGYTGRVLRMRGHLRLIVSISMLRQSVAVEFERGAVTPLRPRWSDDSSQGAVA